MEATADQIGIALDNARLYSETMRQLEELKRTQAQLVHAEKLSAVGELASGVAHEINNPLTTILGQAHLLLEHADVTPHVRERREDRGRRGLAGRAHRAESPAVRASLSAGAAPVLAGRSGAAACSSSSAYQLVQDQIRIEADIVPSPPVWADENQIQQVMLNLVQNAHQAMVKQDGERLLTVRVRATGAAVSHGGARHGPRHRARGPAAAVRSVLHHQAAGRGQRARPVGVVRDRRPSTRAGCAGGTAATGAARSSPSSCRRERWPERSISRRPRPASGRARAARRRPSRRGLHGRRRRPGSPARPAHHRQRGFANANPDFGRPPLLDADHVLRPRACGRPPSPPGASSCPASPTTAWRCARTPTAPTVTWIGHATLLIQLDGVNVLTDPQWSERASPLSFAGPGG